MEAIFGTIVGFVAFGIIWFFLLKPKNNQASNDELKINRTDFKTSHHDYVEIKYGSYNHKDYGYIYPEGYQFPSHTIYFAGFSIEKDRNKLLTSK